MNPQEKSFTQITSDDLAKSCLKYSYALIFHIAELVYLMNDENYLSILTPAFYYLAEHKSVCEYLFTTYKQLKDKLYSLYKKLRDELAIKCAEKDLDEQKLKKEAEECIF